MKFLFLLLPLTAIFILISNKISKALFFFFLNLFITGILYFYIKNPFFGLLVLFLYVGAILVLFLFLLPLLRIKESKKESKMKLFLSFFLIYIFIFISVNFSKLFRFRKPTEIDLNLLSHALIKDFLGFELVSIILLVAIIGAFLLVKDEY